MLVFFCQKYCIGFLTFAFFVDFDACFKLWGAANVSVWDPAYQNDQSEELFIERKVVKQASVTVILRPHNNA